MTLLAHPDDAEILVGGTLIRLRDLGWEVHIGIMTAGDCGSATQSAEEIAAIRRGEARRAAEFIGATAHVLEEKDVNVFFAPGPNRKVIDLMRKVNPTLIFTHPRHDYMMDHEQTHLLARSGAFSFAIPNASSLPVPADAHVPHLYYLDPIEAADPYTGEPCKPSVVVDVSDVIDRKAEMLALHSSQREWLRAHHGMDEYIESMKQHNIKRGKLKNVKYAEAFVQHRGHPFPQNDILAELFNK